MNSTVYKVKFQIPCNLQIKGEHVKHVKITFYVKKHEEGSEQAHALSLIFLRSVNLMSLNH